MIDDTKDKPKSADELRAIKLKNIRPSQFTKENASYYGKRGAAKTIAVKRERKILSELYREYILKNNDTIEALIDKALKEGKSLATMLKELREGSEGSKTHVSGNIVIKIDADDAQL